MDTYLEIAQRILRAARRPMSAKGILEAAYRADILPVHLSGKTQHKTLQARLSEDILYNRASSPFFRNQPGKFFLHELVSDPTIPNQYKENFSARRRTRDLFREPILGIERSFLKYCHSSGRESCNISAFDAAERARAFDYYSGENRSDYAPVWTFSVVSRDSHVLCFRIGRYRDDRDSFRNKQSIGFSGPLSASARSLFSQDHYGAEESALNNILLDLDLSTRSFPKNTPPKPNMVAAFEVESEENTSVFLVLLQWKCPEWFEPTSRKLSINDLRWLDISHPVNNLSDFEPWSRATFPHIFNYRRT